MKQGQLFWGVALLLLGALMLAGKMGITLPNGSSLMELFWSLLLLAAGAWVLAGLFFRGSAQTENAAIDLQGATSAVLQINHGAGEFNLHSGATGGELARGVFAGGVKSESHLSGSVLNAEMNPAADSAGFPFGGKMRIDWDIALNADIPIQLDLNLGANKSTLDLRDITLTGFNLDMGASETVLYLPARGHYAVDIDCGAASLTIHIPQGLAARIESNVVAGDSQINSARFPRQGRYYQSPDFDSAPNTATITIDAGAASVKVL